MSLLVKICGLSTRETLDVALEAGADMVGFVFFPPSPRHISLETARELGNRPKAAPSRWRSRSMPTTRRSRNIVEALQPDILQLHGKETVGAAARHQAALRTAGDEGDRGRDRGRPGAAAAAMPRSPIASCSTPARPRDATRPGGLGAAFDWHVLENLDLKRAVHGVGWARCRERRGSRSRHPRRRRRCVLGRRARARRSRTPTRSAPLSAPRAPPKS